MTLTATNAMIHELDRGELANVSNDNSNGFKRGIVVSESHGDAKAIFRESMSPVTNDAPVPLKQKRYTFKPKLANIINYHKPMTKTKMLDVLRNFFKVNGMYDVNSDTLVLSK
jgi:hypothetical protein